MKRLACFLIAAMLLSFLPEIASAQSNDPFEQQVIQTNPNSKKSNNPRRRRTPKQETTTVTTTPAAPQNNEEKEIKANDGMTVSNPCSDWLDLEILAVTGSKGSQTASITLRFVNHDVNKRIYVGGNFVAYDCEGEEHNRSYSTNSFDAITDVPVKTTLDIPGKINPTKTTVMPVITFNINDCRIEMRNVPIDWK